ncbi:MAG: hypothetical protein V2A66_04295, partial [Pseudomonadota bacterium]
KAVTIKDFIELFLGFSALAPDLCQSHWGHPFFARGHIFLNITPFLCGCKRMLMNVVKRRQKETPYF